MNPERLPPSCLVPIDFSIVFATVEATATMEIADDDPFQIEPVRQDQGSHAHLSRRFYLTVDFLGLRRSGSWSQIINQAQDFSEQFPRHRHLGK